MSKTNNKLIILSFGILAFFVMALTSLPISASAAYGTNFTYSTGDYGNGYNNNDNTNPVPKISSINPNRIIRGASVTTVTITGSGFIPSSVARVNGANRPTTFIDYSHLFIQLNSSDMFSNTGGLYITAYNGAPGGGFSNAAFLNINNAVSTVSTAGTVGGQNTNNNGYNDNSNNTSNTDSSYVNNNSDTNNSNDSVSNLASNAIFGSNSFLPSGIAQWILFAILILIIIIVIRKIFGLEEKYHSAPLKHS